jgi:hypothetical protein
MRSRFVVCAAMVAVTCLVALSPPATEAAVWDETSLRLVDEVPEVPLPSGAQNHQVLWDLTHGVYLQYEPTGYYSDLVAVLAANGFQVTTTTAGVDNVDLSQYDVLVICLGSAWNSAYTDSEVAAIETFVANGGGLLIMGDNASSTPNHNINPVAQAFGTTCGVTDISPTDVCITDFMTHEIFNGVTTICYVAAGELAAQAPSVEAAWAPNGQVALTLVDPCKVVVTGDVNFCANGNLGIEDNQTFVLNVFQCLAEPGPVAQKKMSWGRVKAIYR